MTLSDRILERALEDRRKAIEAHDRLWAAAQAAVAAWDCDPKEVMVMDIEEAMEALRAALEKTK